jgi:hypothetical protein
MSWCLRRLILLFSHSGHLIYQVFACSAITVEGTVFHIREFGLIVMEWLSETEQMLVPNNMHIIVVCESS